MNLWLKPNCVKMRVLGSCLSISDVQSDCLYEIFKQTKLLFFFFNFNFCKNKGYHCDISSASLTTALFVKGTMLFSTRKGN